jgi:hypothetical protein
MTYFDHLETIMLQNGLIIAYHLLTTETVIHFWVAVSLRIDLQ